MLIEEFVNVDIEQRRQTESAATQLRSETSLLDDQRRTGNFHIIEICASQFMKDNFSPKGQTVTLFLQAPSFCLSPDIFILEILRLRNIFLNIKLHYVMNHFES